MATPNCEMCNRRGAGPFVPATHLYWMYTAPDTEPVPLCDEHADAWRPFAGRLEPITVSGVR